MVESLDLANLRRDMLGEALRAMDLHYLTDPDGNYVVLFRWDRRHIHLLLSSDPHSGSITFYARNVNDIFTVDQIPLLLLMTNQFMTTARWPRLTVVNFDGRVEIVADGHLFLYDALEQDEVNRFVYTVVRATEEFWMQFALPNLASLDEDWTGLFSDDPSDGAS